MINSICIFCKHMIEFQKQIKLYREAVMNLGFELTTDDIIEVASLLGKQISLDQANTLFDILDIDRAIDLALEHETEKNQKHVAYKDLAEQFKELGVLSVL